MSLPSTADIALWDLAANEPLADADFDL